MKNQCFIPSALALFILLSLTLQAQPTIQWEKCLGGSSWDVGRAIQQTSDGNYIIAGYAMSLDGNVTGNHGAFDDWIVKLSEDGEILWQKSLGGSDYDYAFSIQQTTDGGYIVAGETESDDGDVSGNHGTSYDFWVVRLDAEGNLLWQKCLGGSGGEWANSIRQTGDGGYIVAGMSWYSNDGDVTGNHGDMDCWVVKLDPDGNLQWQKCLGGTGREEAFSVIPTNDGGYVVAGRTDSNDGDVSGNHGSFDDWIVKLDAAGNIVWQKCLGGSAAEYPFSVRQTSDEGYVVTGFTASFDGDVTGNHSIPGPYNDVWVVKLDSAGNLQWQKCLGGSWDDWGFSVWQTSDGGYVVSCITKSNDQDVTRNHDTLGVYWDYWVSKLDPTGNLQWERCLGGGDDDETYGIQQTDDGGIIAIGSSYSTDGDVTGNHGGGDYWVVKLNTITATDEPTGVFACTVFPNPAHDWLQLTLSQKAEIRIMNTEGKEIKTFTAAAGETCVDISGLADGMYFIQLSQEAEITVKKFIKQ